MAKKQSWISRLTRKKRDPRTWIRAIAGTLYRISDSYSNSDISSIKTQIEVMRALARDPQIGTALSYYATDGTLPNTKGQIIWATSDVPEVADIINSLFKRWDINQYARDHILELATIGNLYIPTTTLLRDRSTRAFVRRVSLDNNTIPDNDFDIVPSYSILPENIVHVYEVGTPLGYIYQPENEIGTCEIHPESSCIHFSLGGLLGNYKIRAKDDNGDDFDYDIKFAQPLMERAVQPTQTLRLLEDALILSSLLRTVKFINVECGDAEETEIQGILQDIKDAIEQQLSMNTVTGDVESFVNPQSPNNMIYLPRIKGEDAISITDLNLSESNSEDSKLLDYYQDKKLSVLGVPKEAMNFSSNEGLGGAGSVLSQRSALYANSLQRLKTAYMAGWRSAINIYFQERGMSGMVDKFDLHMTEIVTTQSTITFEKRDSAISQAAAAIEVLKSLGVKDPDKYKDVLTEIFTEVLPSTGAEVQNWNVNLSEDSDQGGL